MWDRPVLLNRMADILLTLAGALVTYGLWHVLTHSPLLALREVRVTGPLAYVRSDDLEVAIRNSVNGNFFALDLDAVRAAIEKVPWVRSAALRRRWPPGLELQLEEHIPLARWNDVALVNTRGEVFVAEYDADLPAFSGPDGTAKEIAIQYEYFRRGLATIGQTPVAVRVSPRGAWQIRIADGPTLELGREHIEARLARYVAAHERTIARLGQRVEYVDLRYSNGFAVRIPETRFPKTETRGRAGITRRGKT